MGKRVEIQPSTDDQQALRQLTRKGTVSARKLNRARILRLVDEGRAESDISQILGTSGNTIWRTKMQYDAGVQISMADAGQLRFVQHFLQTYK